MKNIVGQNIKRRREELGLTQEQLAKKMHLTSRVSVWNAEHGKTGISSERISRFAEALGCTGADLMTPAGQENRQDEAKSTMTSKKVCGYNCSLEGLAITGRQLIHFIEDNGLEDKFIVLGCEGYTQDNDSATVIRQDPNGNIFITDNCGGYSC